MEDQLAGPTSQLEAARTKCSPLPHDLTELRHYSCGECSQPPGQGVGNQWRRQVTALPGCGQREGRTHPVFLSSFPCNCVLSSKEMTASGMAHLEIGKH